MCIPLNMPQPKIRVLGIPNYRFVEDKSSGKSYVAYQIELLVDKDVTLLERRYSEFLGLHKKIQKKLDNHIDFPPKKMLNKDPKVLNARRLGLENYLQMLLNEFPHDLPIEVYHFLGISISDLNQLRNNYKQEDHIPTRQESSHQPVAAFDKNIYLQPPQELHETATIDAITNGVHLGFYEEQFT